MSKPSQATIDAVVKLEAKYGGGNHSFELREGIFDLIKAAKAEERSGCVKACEDQKVEFLSPEYASTQPIGSICERFAVDQCISAIRSRS